MPSIKWNPAARLILSDVDQTIADIYVPAAPEMEAELESLLEEGKVLFLVSGQRPANIMQRVTDAISPRLRKRIYLGTCNGAEVWGFDDSGALLKSPFYSRYESVFSAQQKKAWRDASFSLAREFRLNLLGTMPIPEFNEKSGGDPLAVMLDDRGSQITLEVPNAYDLPQGRAEALGVKKGASGKYDLRELMIPRVNELFAKAGVPVFAVKAGVFAIDYIVTGVSKTTAVKYIMSNGSLLGRVGLGKGIISHPERMEVWGDNFSEMNGGADRRISEALPREVRSISFREEDSGEFPKGYNIVVWDGERHLHEGLLEFLKSRH